MHIGNNLTQIREAVAAAAISVGRRPEAIKVIAVSKTHAIEAIEFARQHDQRVFGESTAQEALPKISALRNAALEWHFIGHLQSNKAKLIPGNFQWMHSLDNLKLAQRLSRFAVDTDVTLNCLVEVNVTGDRNKHGVSPTDLTGLLDTIVTSPLPGIRLRGLMTIGPHDAAETSLRATFARLRELRDAHASRLALPDFTELSMGMSDDYIAAIKEGSTMVRIGTAIFGERDYTSR